MSAACICCNTNSKFCTPLSPFVSVGYNSRSIAVVVISVGCSAAHSKIISDSLITQVKNASVFFDHCWKSSSQPVRTPLGVRGPFTSMRLGVSFPSREIVDRSHCIGKSRFCGNLSSESEQLLLELCNNLLHRHRQSKSLTTPAIRQVTTFQRFSDRCSSCISPNKGSTRTNGPANHGPPEKTTPQLSCPGHPSTTQKESS